MGHSSDRTLLASLGFADKDRALSRHTLACEWAVSADGSHKILSNAGLSIPKGAVRWRALQGSTEAHISKGEGQYKSTIGFVDATLRYTVEFPVSRAQWRDYNRMDCGHFPTDRCACVLPAEWVEQPKVGVEVKITPTDAAEIIRQIALYRSYTEYEYGKWVVLVDWQLTEMDVGALQREGITPLRLGDALAAFCEAHRGAAAGVVSL